MLLGTSTWKEELEHKADTSEVVEVPSEIVKELLNRYLLAEEPPSGSVSVTCDNCGCYMIIEY